MGKEDDLSWRLKREAEARPCRLHTQRSRNVTWSQPCRLHTQQSRNVTWHHFASAAVASAPATPHSTQHSAAPVTSWLSVAIRISGRLKCSPLFCGPRAQTQACPMLNTILPLSPISTSEISSSLLFKILVLALPVGRSQFKAHFIVCWVPHGHLSTMAFGKTNMDTVCRIEYKVGMAPHTFNPNTWEAQAGISVFRASIIYIESSQTARDT